MNSNQKKRKTVGNDALARSVSPVLHSSKSNTADINIMLSDSDALKLARDLIQGAIESNLITIRVFRKPRKDERHQVTVTYETDMGRSTEVFSSNPDLGRKKCGWPSFLFGRRKTLQHKIEQLFD